MSTASAKEKANLARIRDNQRRSRARRKEYLQELEARLRQCELQGIEASSEIQMAARRVADENKKLRGLLAQHGVADDSVEAYLQSSLSSDSLMQGQYATTSNSVQVLEQLLLTRKVCCVDGNLPQLISGGAGSRDSSVSTVQSMWDPIQPNMGSDPRRGATFPSMGKAASSAQQFMTPSSTASRTSSISHSHRSMPPQHQNLAPVMMPRNPVPGGSRSRNMSQFDFEPQLGISPQPPAFSTQAAAQQHLQPHTAPQRSSVYVATTGDGSSLNMYATDMIPPMDGGGGQSTSRGELDCLPDMDNHMNDQLVFDVMDRYNGTSVGM